MLEGKRILIVEDEPLVAMHLEELLVGHGCHVVGPAYSIAQAKDLALRETIDAAVLDLNVNGETSHRVAEILRSRSVPFAIATGYGATFGDVEAFGGPVLRKPYPAERLKAVLTELLGN